MPRLWRRLKRATMSSARLVRSAACAGLSSLWIVVASTTLTALAPTRRQENYLMATIRLSLATERRSKSQIRGAKFLRDYQRL